MHKKTFTLNNKYLAITALVICLAISVILTSACSQQKQQYNYSVFAFGTIVDITLYDTDQKTANTAFHQLQQLFDKNHQDWSPWTNGDLAQLNKNLNTKSTTHVPEHLLPIIQTSVSLSLLSDNFYNPAIGHLINLWQFHKHNDDDIKPPKHELIQALIDSKPQMSDLTFNAGNELSTTNPAVLLNFGAFAKGYAIKLGIQALRKIGINNAIINAGGDLSVIGKHGTRAWNIGIRHPRQDTILANITANTNESIFTSGDYERFYNYQNKRYHHILNPETGYPTNDTQSVTVIHSDAGYADAAATALFVAGSQNWQSIAKKMNLHYVMLIDSLGDIHLTPEMKDRVKFLNKLPSSRILIGQDL